MDGRTSWPITTHAWTDEVDLDHLAAVRTRAGQDGTGGVRHLVLEVLAYADEEAEHQGRVGQVTVTFAEDGTVTVADDGRGTDTRVDARGVVVRKPVMATRDVRFVDAPDAPSLPDGRPRGGMSTVAALCPVLVHENHRADGAWSQTYRYGVPDDELHAIPPAPTTGTTVRFRPGPAVKGPVEPTADDLAAFRWLEIRVTTPR